MLNSIVKLFKKSTLFLKTPRTNRSSEVFLTWFSMLLVSVSVSVLIKPSMCRDDYIFVRFGWLIGHLLGKNCTFVLPLLVCYSPAQPMWNKIQNLETVSVSFRPWVVSVGSFRPFFVVLASIGGSFRPDF